MLKSVVSFFNHLNIRGWFASFGNISLFNRTYKTELFVVCDSLERFYQFKRNSQKPEDVIIAKEVKLLKSVIDIRMKRVKKNKNFDKFLLKKSLMHPKQVLV